MWRHCQFSIADCQLQICLFSALRSELCRAGLLPTIDFMPFIGGQRTPNSIA